MNYRIFLLVFFFSSFFMSCLFQNSNPTTQYRFTRPTSNLDTIMHYYTKALGLKLLVEFKNHEGYDGKIIGLPGRDYQLEFVHHKKYTKEEIKAPSKENILVFYHSTMKDYEKAIGRIEDYGAKAVKPDNPYWIGKSKTYEDPDGWRIVHFKPRTN